MQTFKIGNKVKIKGDSLYIKPNGIDLLDKEGFIESINGDMYRVCFENVHETDSQYTNHYTWIHVDKLYHSGLTVGATIKVSKHFYIPELCGKKAIVISISKSDILVRFNKQHIKRLHYGIGSSTPCNDSLCWFIIPADVKVLNKPLVDITPFLKNPIVKVHNIKEPDVNEHSVKEPDDEENKVISTTLKVTATSGTFVLNDNEDYAIFNVNFIPQRFVGKTVKVSVEVLD